MQVDGGIVPEDREEGGRFPPPSPFSVKVRPNELWALVNTNNWKLAVV